MAEVEGFNYEFFERTDNCRKCGNGRAFFKKTYCTCPESSQQPPMEWLQVQCVCGYVWNELTEDASQTMRETVFPASVRVVTVAGVPRENLKNITPAEVEYLNRQHRGKNHGTVSDTQGKSRPEERL